MVQIVIFHCSFSVAQILGSPLEQMMVRKQNPLHFEYALMTVLFHLGGVGKYQADITSYDYDAPMVSMFCCFILFNKY